RVDTFYRVPIGIGHKERIFKQPKIDTVMSIPATNASSKSSTPVGADRKIDTFLLKDYAASTCNMLINNDQIHAANININYGARCLTEPYSRESRTGYAACRRGKKYCKNPAAGGIDSIDNNAMAVASVVCARQVLRMKTSSLTPNTQSKIMELPFQGDLLFDTDHKDYNTDEGGKASH
ncbi:UNVERIFIED_CONTAM: hypothetical protein FKN15_009247, partial [Acipenser sinensis]